MYRYIRAMIKICFTSFFALWAVLLMAQDTLLLPGERHFRNIRQYTFGGDNAEAYWSFNGEKLTYQRSSPAENIPCDQIWMLENVTTGKSSVVHNRISNAKGRTTCSYFLPGDSLIVFASTHHAADTCPADPVRTKGKYLWGIYPEYEIYIADLKGNIVKRLTDNNFYDAEATVSPRGDKILFTSDRSGDLELYTMNLDGSGVTQITREIGYDGGAFFSPDGEKIVWRSSVFDTEEELTEYKENIKRHVVSPSKMELFVANADGSNRIQVTKLGGANWAPFFHPSGKKIIFSSNHKTKTIPFNLYMVDTDGKNLEQISFDRVFDSFPMFSPNGKKIVWCSNRNNGGTRSTNIFVADWVE